MTDWQVGDRIRMVAMGDDPHPILPGTTGTITHLTLLWGETTQVAVDWDNGRSLHLILPIDVIERA